MNADGAYNGYSQILLATDLSKEKSAEVYLHELIEAANSQFELKLAHHKIQTLGLALHQALTSGKGRLK